MRKGRVSPHHPTRGLEAPPAGSGADSWQKMDFMHILGQKEATRNTLFGIFGRQRGLQNIAGPKKTFPLPPSA